MRLEAGFITAGLTPRHPSSVNYNFLMARFLERIHR
jgi:hypothetical protein